MHELSLALALIDGVEEECAARGGLRVRSVRVRVGEGSCVSWDALAFAFEVASRDSRLAGARLVPLPAPGTGIEVVGLEVDP